MKSIIKNNYNIIAKYLFVIIIIIVAMVFLPQKNSFNYVYEKGNVWNYKDLYAPFDFPLLKSKEQIQKEKESIQKNVRPFYYIDKDITRTQINKFNKAIDVYSDKNNISPIKSDIIKNAFCNIINGGVFEALQHQGYVVINLIDSVTLKKTFVSSLPNIQSATKLFTKQCSKISGIDTSNLRLLAEQYFSNNIILDIEKTNHEIKLLLNSIPPVYSKITSGSLIVTKGEIIDDNIAVVLNSMKDYYINYDKTFINNNFSKAFDYIIVALVFLSFILVYRPNLIKSNKSFLLLILTLSSVVICIFIALYSKSPNNIYIVPICIVPIIFRAIYDYKIAVFGLILSTLTASLIVPDPFYFIFSNILAGFVIIACISKLEKRSQYFIITLITFVVYSIINLAYNFSHSHNLSSVYFSSYYYKEYAINSILIFVSFPLIFFIEKIFGYCSDISLIELSSTNNYILRKLSADAPGTFQHSNQVANLSEVAARAIKANVLLARVGALYHDIGKLFAPYYFTENQLKNANPHLNLLPEESAKIIISHVTKGLEIASKNQIPEIIKDFIRTHHGTRFSSFFYMNAIEQYGKENINEDDYRYHGPKPFSKETAIVMMADSIEAASKTLQITDEQQIIFLVNNVIDKQIAEQQFVNANISFKDIELIKKAFINSLISSSHLRIKYPEQ